jgi:hypothetical protein
MDFLMAEPMDVQMDEPLEIPRAWLMVLMWVHQMDELLDSLMDLLMA